LWSVLKSKYFNNGGTVFLTIWGYGLEALAMSMQLFLQILTNIAEIENIGYTHFCRCAKHLHQKKLGFMGAS
jgi:hypothetical protein